MDFTLKIYKHFLETLISKGYKFVTFKDFIISRKSFTNDAVIILRHDVDHIPANSLKTASIENLLGIKGVYYFRIIPSIYDKDVIKKIADSGHEIGYQYEDVDLIRKNMSTNKIVLLPTNGKNKKNEDLIIDKSYQSFCKHLEEIRHIYPVKTICAHGSPLSPYDNKIMWEKYDYKNMGVIGDTSLDINWEDFAYFTDTGRRWNGSNVNIRDKVTSKYNFTFRSTKNIISNIDSLPRKIMFTIHTHRWFNPGIMWMQELIFQNMKNVVKYYIVKKRRIN